MKKQFRTHNSEFRIATKSRNSAFRILNSAFLLLLVLMVSLVGMFSLTASAAEAATDLPVEITGADGNPNSVTLKDADGDGYYDIGTADELYAFAAAVNGGNTAINGELTADIVVNENVLDANGDLNDTGSNFRVWTPIGRSGSGNRYIGNFDGGNHTVSGLYFNDSSAKYVGLFGIAYDGATIKNVGVVDSWMSAKQTVGGIVGEVHNTTTILNCYNTGTVHSTEHYSGGIAGYVGDSCTVINCYNAGKIGGNEEVGGVVGMQGYSTAIVNNCYNIGTVSGPKSVGGIVGSNQGTVTNCYNIGTVVGNTNVGTVTGLNIYGGNVTSCYYLAGSTGIGSDRAWNGSVISDVTEEQVKAASGKDGALVDLLNKWVAQQNDAKYKGWHFCPSISSEYPSLYYECAYSDSGKNHIAKCTLCGSETTEAHTYIYTANEGAINESCELCEHSASINLVLPEAPVYNENTIEASYTGSFANPDATVSIQYLQSNEDSETGYDVLETAPVDAGTYTVRLSVDEVYVEQSMTIAPKEITLIGAEVEDKDYDGTPYVEIDPTYGHDGFKTEGVSIYDSIKILCTSAELEFANAGQYKTVTVKGLTVEGEDAHNYTVVSEAAIPVYNIWGNYESSVTVYERYVDIDLLDQEAGSLDAIDQNKWEIGEDFGLLEGHRIDSIKLIAEMNSGSVKYGSISVEEGSLKIVDADGNDVTKNYSVTAYAATLTITCPDHDEFENGFCKNCGGFEKPNYNENEDYYEIANAGQLFWFAEYIANVTNEANAKLMDDITIPEGKEWIPIYNLYGTFDGNYKTISGLHVSESDNQYVGFLGYIGSWADVRNLHITNSSFVDADATYVGAIVGYHGGGEITNCYTDETVKIVTNGTYGALVGGTSYSTMKNCYAHDVLAGNGHYGTFENCYYIGEDDGIDGTTAMTAEQFASGEVAYRLQSGIVGEDIWDDETGEWIGTAAPEHVWGQTCGVGFPAFGGAKVYSRTACNGTGIGYTNDESDTVGHLKNRHGYCELCEVKITGASITVGVDLTMKYYVNLIETTLVGEGEKLAMQFTMNGKTVTVIGVYDEAKGEYVFAFENIAPQQMADLIDATLVVLGENSEVVKTLDEKTGYSVKANAEELLKLYKDDAALVQFVTDMLYYGAAAQNYKDYNLDNLANADVENLGAPSEALPEKSDKSIIASTSEDVYFTSVTVRFDNVNKIGVFLSTTDNVTLKVNGEKVQLTGTTYYTDAIYATGFDTLYTFELYEGETLVQTLTYSVSSYVYSMMSKVDAENNPTEMAELAKALYRYGASAVAYINAQNSET